jgi:Amt family ammonium transporter
MKINLRRLSSYRPLLRRLGFLLIAIGAAQYARAQSDLAIQPANPVAQYVQITSRSLNYVWTLLAGFLVMFMQSGFALIETGMCRAKNAAHTMSMNFLVYSIAMCAFFVCGYAFMCGGVNGVPGGPGGPAGIGLDHVQALHNMLYLPVGSKNWGLLGASGFFLLGGVHRSAGALVWFFYMMVFMDTAVTIPTGTLAERWKFKSFALFSLAVAAFIYPVYGCWMWGGGWLSQLGRYWGLGHGAVDFAGSSVVHLQGGLLALAGVLQLGPRIGKYDEEGNPRPIFGHDMPMVMFGTLLLAFCWFGFNAGSTLAGVSDRIGLIAVNTMLASGAGTIAAAFYLWNSFGKPDPSLMCNGMLGGLVSITACCAFVSPPAAVFIGLVAGLITVLGVLQLERRGIDDPVGAISVHAISGLWGLLAVGLFSDGSWGDGYNGVSGNVTGLFYGNHQLGQLAAQCIAGVTCIAWNMVVGGGVFLLLGHWLRSNRVSPQVEVAGLDIPEMGTPGYPEFITTMSQEQVTSDDISAARS